MQFKVKGAKRDTGEAVSVMVEAASAAEATDRANRRGILVERCDPAMPSSTGTSAGTSPSKVAASPVRAFPTDDGVAAPPKTPAGGRKWILLGAMIGVTAAILLLALYLLWIKPRDESQRKTLQDAVAQMERTAEMQKAADAQRLAALNDKMRQMGIDPNAPMATSSAISPASSTAKVSGEVWVQKQNGDTLAIAATEVYLLPSSLTLTGNEAEIKDGVTALQIRIDVSSGRPNDAAAKATATAAQRLINLVIAPTRGSRSVNTDDLAEASAGIIDIKADESRTVSALAGRRLDASSREMERTIKGESFWKLLTSRTLSHVVTDRDGKFQFDAVEAGKYVVVCRAFLPALQAVIYWSQAIDATAGKDIVVSFSADKGKVIGY